MVAYLVHVLLDLGELLREMGIDFYLHLVIMAVKFIDLFGLDLHALVVVHNELAGVVRPESLCLLLLVYLLQVFFTIPALKILVEGLLHRLEHRTHLGPFRGYF